jgi:hypothetical protein
LTDKPIWTFADVSTWGLRAFQSALFDRRSRVVDFIWYLIYLAGRFIYEKVHKWQPGMQGDEMLVPSAEQGIM